MGKLQQEIVSLKKSIRALTRAMAPPKPPLNPEDFPKQKFYDLPFDKQESILMAAGCDYTTKCEAGRDPYCEPSGSSNDPIWDMFDFDMPEPVYSQPVISSSPPSIQSETFKRNDIEIAPNGDRYKVFPNGSCHKMEDDK